MIFPFMSWLLIGKNQNIRIGEEGISYRSPAKLNKEQVKLMPESADMMNEDTSFGKDEVGSNEPRLSEDGKFYTDHARNCTGIAGPRLWSDDEEVNRLWDQYGKLVSNGIKY